MQLLKFRGENVHGFLKFNIPFKRDLNFLTGINGSGKTTALHAIVSLITPSLSTLADLNYDFIRIEFKHNNQNHFIQSKKEEGYIFISCSESESIFSYNKFELTRENSSYRELDFEQNYYRDLLAASTQNPVLKFIGSLPTPMFLGLDRRARMEEDSIRSRPSPIRSSRLGRNIFSSSLSSSLVDAAALAEDSYRDMLIASGRVGDTLRREMLLQLISVKPSTDGFATIAVPTDEDLYEINQMQRGVEALPDILGLPRNEVRQRVLPFLETLRRLSDKIPRNLTARDILMPKFVSSVGNSEIMKSVFDWSSNLPQLKRINVLSKVVDDYNEKIKNITAPTTSYLNLLNNFLDDSGKKVEFNSSGYIHFNIAGVSGHKPMAALSSGEAQIFVLLTHLFFNPQAKGANVFIIDEPELSLHVQWQELFVESIQEANPDIQYVLATHSPSIILGNTASCIDITRKVPRRRD